MTTQITKIYWHFQWEDVDVSEVCLISDLGRPVEREDFAIKTKLIWPKYISF